MIDGMAPTTSSDVYFDALVPASLQPSIGAEVGTPLVMSVVCQNQRAPTASCERQYLYLQIQPKALISKIPGFFFLLPAPRLDPAPRLQAILLMRACSRQCAMP